MTETPIITDSTPESDDAVNHAAYMLLEKVEGEISQRAVESFEDCREIISDWVLDECNVLDLDLDQKLGLVEDHADEFDLFFDSADIDTIRMQIISRSAEVVQHLAEEKAQEAYQDLERFMGEHGFVFSDLRSSNYFEWSPHRSEHWVGERCTVYVYRNVEGIDVDIWEYQLLDDRVIYLERGVSARTRVEVKEKSTAGSDGSSSDPS